MSKNLKLILVAGARPNFMKIAPIISAIKKFNNSINLSHLPCNEYVRGEMRPAPCSVEATTSGSLFHRDPTNPTSPSNPSNPINPINPSNPINYVLVHTGQHYDVEMSEAFFSELELPNPDINLEVGSASHAVQTANIMIRFEEVCLREKPHWIIVVGDVNSTMACTLVASKLGIKVGHVEAGLRSFDRSMPEEINRIVTDALSDLLFTPSEDADENLKKEGIPIEKIKRVGNIMIDTLVTHLDKARHCKSYNQFGLKEKDYVFVTLHRPPNVDNKISLSMIMECLIRLSQNLPVIFPVHPRTRKKLEAFGLWEEAEKLRNLRILEPIGYLDTICLEENSRFVLTDSGGIQEETTFLGVPCLTLRPNTERPITIHQGTNKLTSLETLEQDFDYALNGYHPARRIPELWDGHTAERIIKILAGL
jgi:UDP-N-acetylglucosamine 2-epimerase (non-hydrolysing)